MGKTTRKIATKKNKPIFHSAKCKSCKEPYLKLNGSTDNYCIDCEVNATTEIPHYLAN